MLGCAYEKISDTTCSATTIRCRRDEWITAGTFIQLEQLCLEAYDRIVGLELEDLSVDGCIVKAPCDGEIAGRSPVDRGKQGAKRSVMTDTKGIPLGVIGTPANRHDSPLLKPTLDRLDRFNGHLPEQITVHLDAGYDSAKPGACCKTKDSCGKSAPKANRYKPGPGGWWKERIPGIT